MLLRTNTPSKVDDLCVHFTRSGFSAQSVGGTMVEVFRPDAPSADQERREIELHLRIWQATNDGATAEVAD
jgi:hypothetical protein